MHASTSTQGEDQDRRVIDLDAAHEVEVDQPLPRRAVPSWLRRYVLTLVGLDAALALVSALTALLVRFGSADSDYYFALTLLFPLGWVVAMASVRAYETRFLGLGSEEFKRVFDGAVRYGTTIVIVSYALRLDLARGYLVVALPMAAFLDLLGRYAARQVVHRLRSRGRCLHRMVVVGRQRSISELVTQLRREPHAGLDVVGVCLDRGGSAGHVDGIPVIGSSADVASALRDTGADTVAITAYSDLTQADLRRLSWELEGTGVDVLVAPNLTDIAGPRLHIRPVAGLPLLHIDEPEFTGGRRLVKGAIDKVVALLALTVLSPVVLVAAVAVRTTSRGPVLFRQVRVGRRGEQFRVFKFRSMRSTAEEELAALVEQNESADGLLFKIRNDPRVTRVGALLRRFSIDELPQLVNVLLGQMSLVGPRPPLPSEVEQYGDDVRRRLLVKPGITGLWQISGRSDLSWVESVRLDLQYVENWTLALDLMIVWKTVFAVLGRKGAY